MPSITARQVRNRQLKKGEKIKPKEVQAEAEAAVKEFSGAFDIWTIGFLDIETTGLGADFGHILGACIKPSTSSKIITFRIDDYKGYKKNLCNDKPLVLDIVKEMSKYDVLVHYNGDMFDLPFIDTRLAVHGEKRSPLVHSVDMLPIVKRKLRLHSNRLDAVATALELTNQKTKLQPMVWARASHGSKPDLDYIMEHCEADVLVLEEVFRRLKSYVDTIFRRR